jgi:hypothetical protein
MKALRGHGKRAYSETVWAVYGMGARQSLREDNWKYIRYSSKMYEEFFDLSKYPLEQNNLIDRLKMFAPKWLQQLREEVNDNYKALPKGIEMRTMPDEEREAVDARLRALGYIVD